MTDAEHLDAIKDRLLSQAEGVDGDDLDFLFQLANDGLRFRQAVIDMGADGRLGSEELKEGD